MKKILNKIRWFIAELTKMYSDKPSYFSKKRVESGIAFIIAEWGSIFFLIKKVSVLTGSDFVLWVTAQFAVAGYIINQIQKEKNSIKQDGE